MFSWMHRLMGGATSNWVRLLDAAASVAVVVACGVFIFSTFKKDALLAVPPPAMSVPASPLIGRGLELSDSPTLGAESASVLLVAFSDFQCPYCGRFAREVFPAIKKRLIDTQQVRFAFMHLPLKGIHAQAVEAASYAECSRQFGRFWEMHDALFDLTAASAVKAGNWDTFTLAAGVSAANVAQCRAGWADIERKVDSDARVAADLGISSTPTFIIATGSSSGYTIQGVIPGAKPIEVFETEVRRVSALIRVAR